MARYKGYDYTQTVMVPLSLDNQLLASTLEFAIQALTEADFTYNRDQDC